MCLLSFDDALMELKKKWNKDPKVVAGIVFGSYLTGKQSHDSDIDMVIVREGIKNYFTDHWNTFGIPVEIRVHPYSSYRSLMKLETPPELQSFFEASILRYILEKGKIVYDKKNRFGRFLEEYNIKSWRWSPIILDFVSKHFTERITRIYLESMHPVIKNWLDLRKHQIDWNMTRLKEGRGFLTRGIDIMENLAEFPNPFLMNYYVHSSPWTSEKGEEMYKFYKEIQSELVGVVVISQTSFNNVEKYFERKKWKKLRPAMEDVCVPLLYSYLSKKDEITQVTRQYEHINLDIVMLFPNDELILLQKILAKSPSNPVHKFILKLWS